MAAPGSLRQPRRGFSREAHRIPHLRTTRMQLQGCLSSASLIPNGPLSVKLVKLTGFAQELSGERSRDGQQIGALHRNVNIFNASFLEKSR
jgi:hypothetical protein